MISHGKDIKIFTGNANPKLAADICRIIGTKLGESEVKSFADGEASVSLYETVRGSDVFLVQSTCKPVNDSLMELLIMVDACRRASAGRITAVMPYFGYARQDRKAKSRDPISAKLVANLITRAGADRVATGENPVIVACRSGVPHNYDIVEGPMADDTIFNYVQSYTDGEISRAAFWELARFKHPTHQISFHTARALAALTFERSYEVHV